MRFRKSLDNLMTDTGIDVEDIEGLMDFYWAISEPENMDLQLWPGGMQGFVEVFKHLSRKAEKLQVNIVDLHNDMKEIQV